ncbi:lipoprotein-releasing ABC transporter ATP-binding protein LolD [Aliidiomarina haloalkalitolerans]|uniref:Lipoprotein-releasing system ATP-binding protein LolD n=1 Tax=Aliidiomarina haloalkalitolerans TaxID=859059 RepID=A0A432VY01_9GAMM|nr:lipoprotein-releasing ABC transporter ATP-binding protein LolD [Aliidiomarina haloalkalitolerans]RUO21478.1 lipoprotein-releasing system ATP-binding protein LolD [Aliidiomarina haloalkalitolerans]
MNKQDLLVSVSDLNKSYQDGERIVTVLEGVDLQLQAGEMLAIIGASGSGKSTLLHILGGLDKADSGQVTIAGEQPLQLPQHKLAQWRNQHVGFIYQFHHLLSEFSALENVAMPLLIAGAPMPKALAQAKSMLERVGLGHRLEHAPAKLSGGERQRVAIARALVNQPALVLADEPTGNLDEDTAQVIYDLMLELNSELGTAFVVVTHDIQLAAKLPRQLQLDHGRLVEEQA